MTREEHKFWSKVQRDPTCWIWMGSRKDSGYGVFFFSGKNWMAHRLSYTMAYGSIPKGLVLDHLCSNRSCVNPAHLEPVTQLENVKRSVRNYFSTWPMSPKLAWCLE